MMWGQWIYYDKSFCQPDIVVVRPHRPLIIVEVKLTRKRGVEKKLRSVYAEAVGGAYPGVPLCFAQVYKNMDGPPPDAFDIEYIFGLKPNQYAEVMWR